MSALATAAKAAAFLLYMAVVAVPFFFIGE